MIAAIYARKSNDDGLTNSEAKSVTRQLADARSFIIARGWSLMEAHVYVDDGKSGALFRGRPEFQRMLTNAAAGEFDALVLFDLDRFGRQGEKSNRTLYDLADVGVTIYDCSTGQPVDLDSIEGETMAFMKTRFAAQFRDQIRKHTRMAMRQKAELGWATGGKIFGYDNVRIAKGHAELRVNDAEAAVVRRIYELCVLGQGARTIAALLNRIGTPKPRAQQGRKDGWSASTIRAVLIRPLYRGLVIYGRTQKAYNRELQRVYRGTNREKGQIPQPDSTWIQRERPELRIIDPALAERVDRRLADRRTRYLTALQRQDGGHKAVGRYLLSGGMLICPTCGGHFEARKYPWKGNPGSVYSCATRRRKPGICTNTLALPITETDTALLSVLEGEILSPRLIAELLSLVAEAPDETAYLTQERDRLRTEVDRLVRSIAAGVPAESVAPLIRENESKIQTLELKLRQPAKPRLGTEQLRAALEQRVAEWKAQLRAEPTVARLVLRRLIGPLVVHDAAERPDFVEWMTEPRTELLDGLATLEGASPKGMALYPLTGSALFRQVA